MAGKGKVHSQANGEKAELAHLKPALQELLSAWECADDVQSDPWQFAVETADLTALGLGKSGLRWLVRKGFAEHARELTRRGDAARGFQPEPSLAFTSKSCFILTAAGHSWLERAGAAPAVLRLYETPAGALAVAALSPRWDLRTRTLYLGDQVVKRYRVPAENQEAVLSAFEEEGWVQTIDDPLSPTAEVSPGVRLRDTVRRLNAGQTSQLLHFYGDGSGEHVLWEILLPPVAARQILPRTA